MAEPDLSGQIVDANCEIQSWMQQRSEIREKLQEIDERIRHAEQTAPLAILAALLSSLTGREGA